MKRHRRLTEKFIAWHAYQYGRRMVNASLQLQQPQPTSAIFHHSVAVNQRNVAIYYSPSKRKYAKSATWRMESCIRPPELVNSVAEFLFF